MPDLVREIYAEPIIKPAKNKREEGKGQQHSEADLLHIFNQSQSNNCPDRNLEKNWREKRNTCKAIVFSDSHDKTARFGKAHPCDRLAVAAPQSDGNPV